MANTLDPMDLKQIITLQLDGFSDRKTGFTLGISRNTVNTYRTLFRASDYSFKELLAFDTAELVALFPSYSTIDNQRYQALMLTLRGSIKPGIILVLLFYTTIRNIPKQQKTHIATRSLWNITGENTPRLRDL